MNELSPHAAQVHAAMVGPAPDLDGSGGVWAACTRLTPVELGTLLPTVYRILGDEGAPGHARRAAREVTWVKTQPSFTAAALTDFYAALAESPKPTHVCLAAGALLRCADPWDQPALAAPATALVAAASVTDDHIVGAALAVAALAGPTAEAELVTRLRAAYENSPLRLAELEVIRTTGARERAWLAEDRRYATPSGTWPPLTDQAGEHPRHTPHTFSPPFAELARRTLHSAADHLAAIHAGQVPYAADKAFTPADTETLRRAARLALRHDEPWAGDVLTTLLPQLSVAPTAARTLPSQGACIVLAQAVEAYPTPESVAALREARRVVRHAGVTKKLDRILHRAERNLGRRPEILVRLPGLGYGPDGTRRIRCGAYTAVLTAADEPTLAWERADGRPLRSLPSAARRDHPETVTAARDVLRKTRAQIRTLLRGLEGGFLEASHLNGTVYRFDRWREALATHPVVGAAVRRLIWEIEYAPGDWRATLPEADRSHGPDPAPSAAVRLWHPARATEAERHRWRDRITDLRLRQPFRQAYREHYLPEEADETGTTAMFHGHLVRIESVLGLAARHGWSIEDDCLALSLPGVTAYFGVAAKLYPGATGWAEAQDVHLVRGLDPVKRSEILRSVDLLISASSYAWRDTTDPTHSPSPAHDRDSWRELNRLYELPLRQTARLRREALQRIFAGHISSGRVEFGPRHLRLNGHDIHLATGRVTRDGDPVDIVLPESRGARPLPFLPYDEKLLERIVHMAEELMARQT
ncbi:hypothetical protein ADL29_32580 [Streptomyces chattanoogensis]|uniref:DUF4132 domain-containing protein n=2 Tax=Streptomyces chattanoogensis TaxID=66876 RepID=A0A0N0GW57_9ACTN|nr:hypothetical protein ADL29_32580 [Streptomyces chattanoogensis]